MATPQGEEDYHTSSGYDRKTAAALAKALCF
jgi:hypothetical protein